ncbi:MAG: ADP-ribosylation factor-like protein [Oscillospiraceae bacterium]|nr:ADP-ribosylation factor-like protein [Oscillospiraceae bacterium]
MSTEMSKRDFKDEVKKRIQEQLNLKEQQNFAWLCAVRALPFLSVKRGFKYRKKNTIQTHLQSVFFALDMAIFNVFGSVSTVYTDAAYADAAYAAAGYADRIDAAVYAAYAAYAAADTANISATDLTICANYATATAAAVVSAAAAAGKNHIKNFTLKFQELIFNDIEMIRTGKYDQLRNNTSIYGGLWQDFQDDLTTIGCGYWAALYTEIFANSFQADSRFPEAVERRINVPSEVHEQGAAAVADYLEDAEKQGVVDIQRETRLIVLGSAGAGKTTLVRRLNGDDSYPEPKDTTHGVDTKVKLDFSGTKTHVWDFGGQVIYHASHRCFMSENCVYILVVNARTEDNRDIDRIHYWLDTIRIYSNDRAKVLIVVNESDNREQNVEEYDSLKDGEHSSLIQEIYSFNIGEDMDSMTAFKSDLAAYVESVGHQTFGRNDSRAMQKIKELFDHEKKILTKSELEDILTDNEIQEPKDQIRAKALFNTLGVALSYDFMDNYVLDPYWISHGIYKVIDYLQKNKSKFIRYNELDRVFENERGDYPKRERKYILELMGHHKIGFSNEGGVRGLIVPCAASFLRPKDITVEVDPDNLVTRIERNDRQEFPADFFYKYICINKNDIQKNNEIWAMWQTGMALAGERASALVALNRNTWIEITVWGDGKEKYRKKLERHINDLLQEYRFTSEEDTRKQGKKVIKYITLAIESAAKVVIESIAKGVTKGIID